MNYDLVKIFEPDYSFIKTFVELDAEQVAWILETNNWNDLGEWKDTSTWND